MKHFHFLLVCILLSSIVFFCPSYIIARELAGAGSTYSRSRSRYGRNPHGPFIGQPTIGKPVNCGSYIRNCLPRPRRPITTPPAAPPPQHA